MRRRRGCRIRGRTGCDLPRSCPSKIRATEHTGAGAPVRPGTPGRPALPRERKGRCRCRAAGPACAVVEEGRARERCWPVDKLAQLSFILVWACHKKYMILFNVFRVINVPKFIRPCQPVASRFPAMGKEWLHELQLAGQRFQVVKDGRCVRLFGRRGGEWTRHLPHFAEAFRKLPCCSCTLDGDLVLPDADDAADLEGLSAATAISQWEPVFFAFDLLYRDGHDLRPLSLVERKQRLNLLVNRAEIRCLHLVQTFENGKALLAAAEQHGLEGVVSKRRDSPYQSGTCRDWRRVKTTARCKANREPWRSFARAWFSDWRLPPSCKSVQIYSAARTRGCQVTLGMATAHKRPRLRGKDGAVRRAHCLARSSRRSTEPFCQSRWAL